MTTPYRMRTTLAVVFSFAALAACGGGSAQGTGGGASSSSSSSAGAGPGPTQINEPGGIPAGYTLHWSDEFNTDGLPDPTKWSYDTGRNKDGWYNNEKQYYSANRPENARVQGGNLIIEARKEALSANADWGGQQYTSARLLSKMSYQYGHVESRAFVTCPKGSWPAIWQLPSAPYNSWPDDGEIDIMEYVGWNAGKIYQSVHTRAYYHSINTQKSVLTDISDACNAWHVYEMTWTADRITMGIDGRNYFSFRNDGSGDYTKWPFIHPQFLILNLAVGGDFGGVGGIDDASLPWQFKVDYVRVYTKP